VFERLENPRATEAEEGQATLYGLVSEKGRLVYIVN
jgi:hypothetical protein